MKGLVKFINESYDDAALDAAIEYLENCDDLESICQRGEPDTWEELWDNLESLDFDIKKLKKDGVFLEEVMNAANEIWMEENGPRAFGWLN